MSYRGRGNHYGHQDQYYYNSNRDTGDQYYQSQPSTSRGRSRERKVDEKLKDIFPSTYESFPSCSMRVKRGLINGLGSIFEAVTGNLDSGDGERHIICLGDININLLDSDSASVKYMTDMLHSIDIEQIVSQPTHITANKASLIDVILCSNPSLISSCSVGGADISDHELVSCVLNIDDKLNIFNSRLIGLFDKHLPIKSSRITKPKAPWLNDEIKKMMKDRDAAKSKFRKTPSTLNWDSYKNSKNRVNHAISKAKRNHLQTITQNFENWLSDLSERENVHYVKQNSNSNNKSLKYYICNRGGKFVPETESEERQRSLKSQGSCKIGASCTNQMIIKKTDGKCKVTYYKEYYGHPIELQHIPIPKKNRNMLAAHCAQLSSGVHNKKVLGNIRDNIGNKLKRIDLLDRKDLQNIKNSYNLKQDEGKLHKEDSISIDL
nr:unnamed protein product [Callosobruchus chinensis]